MQENTIEIRWHGRGGQGAKTASQLLAEIAFEAGKMVQSFPEYGAERQGAPMKAFNRISDKPIRVRCAVQNPDIVIVIDPTLLSSINVLEGTDENTILIANTAAKPQKIREKLNFKGKKVYTVDATKISLEELGQNRPNTPILGALAHVFDYMTVDDIIKHFEHKMARKLPEDLIEANKRAIKRGYEEVQVE